MGYFRTRTRPDVSRSVEGFRKITTYTSVNNKCTTTVASTSTSKTSEVVYNRTESMYDYVYDKFYSRQAAGEILNSEMNKSRVEVITQLTQGTIYSISGCTKVDFYVNYIRERGIAFLGPPSNFAASLDAMAKQASTQSVANVSSQEIDILATIGELKETKELLVKAAFSVIRLGKIMRDFARFVQYGSTKNLRKPLTRKERYANYYLGIENFWMEMRMGWRPFLFECQNLYSAITKAKEYPKRQTFRGKREATFTNSDVISNNNGRMCIFNRSYTNKVVVRAGTIAEQRTHGWPDVFGITKIPQAIWELTKLSWAVDYFFNVGQAIAAYVPDTLWNPLASWYVITQHIESTIEMVNSYQVDGSFVPPYKGGLSVKTEDKQERHPCAYLGISYFPRMNVAKYLDILAVARQYFNKSLKLLKKAKPKKRRKA